MKNTTYLKNLTYQKEVENLKGEIYNTRFDEIRNMGLLGRYLTISANLSTFLPMLKDEKHYKIIQNIQFHRSLSNIDQFYPELLLEKLMINDKYNVINGIKNKAHIIVTYHTGSYRTVIQYLNKKDISFCLVTEKRYIKEQGITTQKLYKKINKDKKELEILPAENPRLLFDLVHRLRKGISIVFYIDGNTGSTKKKLSENKNLLKINFLRHHIYARQGIAFLAYLSKAPLSTMIIKRDKNLNNTIYVKPVETIDLIKKYNRNSFIHFITKELYQELEHFLDNNIEQWEGWFYIDKFFHSTKPCLDTNTCERKKTYKIASVVTLLINEFIHLIAYDDERIFLVKKREYQILRITKKLYDILTYFKVPKKITTKEALVIHDQKIEWKIINELIEMDYLKPI